MSPNTEVGDRVIRVLVDALSVESSDIVPTAKLQEDLGAESIDFLDIVFRLEQEFGIEIPTEELFPETIFRGDPTLVQDGRVTERGLDELRSRMPYADLSGFEGDRRLGEVPSLFTVDLLTRYVGWKLERQRSRLLKE
jgi:acyl carrier protein